MYIEKKNIGGLKYCEGCPYFKLKTDNCLYADSELRGINIFKNGIIVKCEHHDICYRIDLKVCEEKLKNDIKKEGE